MPTYSWTTKTNGDFLDRSGSFSAFVLSRIKEMATTKKSACATDVLLA